MTEPAPASWRDAPATPLAILSRAVAAAPAATALVAGEVRLTYADYARAVTGLAKLLGPLAGCPVALLLGNGVEICIAGFAVQAAGGIVAALNPDYTPRELTPMLADAAPAAVIVASGLVPRLRDAGYAGPVVVADGALAAWIAAGTPTLPGRRPGLACCAAVYRRFDRPGQGRAPDQRRRRH